MIERFIFRKKGGVMVCTMCTFEWINRIKEMACFWKKRWCDGVHNVHFLKVVLL